MPTKKSTPVKKNRYKSGNTTVEFGVSTETLHNLAKENELLREKIAMYETPQGTHQPMAANKPAPVSTMLTQFCEQMDGQLSRLLNSVNMLERTTERIQSTDNKQGTAMGNSEPVDLSFRLGRIVEDFSYQNMRLEDLNAKLNNLI